MSDELAGQSSRSTVQLKSESTVALLEGTDGVGRSTQISLLREWLEVQGYGVIETGWTRSELMSPTIDLAKSSTPTLRPPRGTSRR